MGDGGLQIPKQYQIFFGATPYKELETRIDKYLKENKEEKIIDTEKLASSLKKPKKEVEEAFKELAKKKSSEMRKKDGESGKGGGKGKGRKKGQGNDYFKATTPFCGDIGRNDIAYQNCVNHADHCDDISNPNTDDYFQCLKYGCNGDPWCLALLAKYA